MSGRDDEFARLAREYAAANANLIEAQRVANQALVRATAARKECNDLCGELAGFVSGSIRSRKVVVGGKLVRVEYDGNGSGGHAPCRAEVSVEELIFPNR